MLSNEKQHHSLSNLKNFLRWFPEPEEVFACELEKHKQHFLPILSIDIRCLLPKHTERWLHFVQPSDIYEGCIGMETTAFHQGYNFADSFCFDVNEQGKYCFNGDWRLFESEHTVPNELIAKAKQQSINNWQRNLPINWENLATGRLKQAITANHRYYQLLKHFYQKHKHFPTDENCLLQLASAQQPLAQSLQQLEQAEQNTTQTKTLRHFDIAGLSDIFQPYKQEEGISENWQLFQEQFGNLFDTPKRQDGRVFDYIGSLCGEDFQAYGCDELYLFFDEKQQKAVIRLVYS